MTLEERFWEKVDVRGPDECWEWKAAHTTKGYGCIKVNGENKLAHRVIFYLKDGEFPDDCVCHHCDNPKCVNPNHLFIGTYSDNMKDAYEKGRIIPPDGAKHGFKKGHKPSNRHLTDEEAIEIKKRIKIAKWGDFKIIAEEFNIPRQTVKDISAGHRYINLRE